MDADGGATDLTIMNRGRWRSLRTVARYRKPAAYLRALSALIVEQQAVARTAPCLLPKLFAKLLGDGKGLKRKRA